MNKNVVFGGIALLSIAIVAGLLLWEPGAKTPSFESGTVKEEATEAPQIAIKEKRKQEFKIVHSSQSKPIQPKPKKKKKIDPTIKNVTVDHYRKYVIQLIDPNPEDKEIKLTNDPSKYIILSGKISGNQFALRVPKEIAYSSNLKLKITDIQTHKTKTIDANFINDLASMQGSNSDLRVDIDFNNPKNIRVKTIEHPITEVSAIPHL